MIEQITIKNFKNLSHLHISHFSRINLISGRNNVGKSSLLEAICILFSENFIRDILTSRGELPLQESKDWGDDRYLSAISSIFKDRNVSVNEQNAIEIRDQDNSLILKLAHYDNKITNDGFIVKRRIIDNDNDSGNRKYPLAVIVKRNDSQKWEINPLTSFLLRDNNYLTPRKELDITHLISIDTIHDDSKFTAGLWDQVVVKNREQEVVDALKIIDPKIKNVTFIGEGEERKPYVSVEGYEKRIPLKSMGDGINHILIILSALVNNESGCLIIDEIDNGLHYTVQKELWKVIFETAKKLDVQVFATTHSSDCISSFSAILQENNNAREGCYLRLEQKNGNVRAVSYDAQELKIIAAQNIEVR